MTISPAVLDAMVAAGCTAEQIAAVVKADMAANEDKRAEKRSKDAERQRRHRARNAESHSVTRDTSDTSPSSPVPLVPPSQTLPPIIPQSSSPPPSLRSATKRASRLPDDWALPREWGLWAVQQGLSEAQVRLEGAKFRDYWVAKSGRDATKTDWLATWRNWIRNCGRSVSAQGPPAERRESITDVLKRQVLEMQNGCEAEEGDGVGEADGFGSAVLRLASPLR